MFLVPLAGAAMGMSAGTAGLIGSGLSAATMLFSGMAQQQSANAESAMASQNAATMRENAARIRNDANEAEGAQRRDARKELGKIEAAIGQNGGGSELLMRQSVTDAELDALNIRYRGATEAHAQEVEAASYAAQAKNAKAQGKAAMIGAVLGAGGRMLSGVGDYGVWKAGQTQAAPQVVTRSPGRMGTGPS